MTTTRIARSSEDRLQHIEWDESSPLTVTAQTARGTLQTRHGRFTGGRAEGVEIVQINTGAAIVNVLPSRGMAVWDIECGRTRFGWESPVNGPVHPSLVPIHDPSGLGWLEGFDELLVRCGLESNGAPEHDDAGRLVYPLHGRIGNLPADSLHLEYDEVSGRLELSGDLRESRLFFSNFHLRSRIRVNAGSSVVEILDDVTNERSTPASMQMLYHINVGPPVLGKGSKLIAPIEELAPKDNLSAGEIESWNQFPEPQSGYAERVYFAKLRYNDTNLSTAMLQDADAKNALAVSFSAKTLPRFILWKNTADLADGYVAGLEPATNYPNTRSYEESQDRVVELQPDQTVSFRVALEPLTDSKSISAMAERIERITEDEPSTIHNVPRPGWSPGA